ncbi:MAG TPA: sigma-54 dependent transcriptional regulator [Gemmatimonadales bacterium]|jgi:two-component system nitrogen regulation response regulator GlnG|nr:sigma-54 dependent transcriptional regulator [Gemmatimonadales bacterium]
MAPRLLLVDDDPDLVDFVTRALGTSNLAIECAGSGEAALDRVRQQPPQLVLLDLVLPGIDGLETLRRLRREGFELPVVLITGRGDMETAIRAMEEGAWDYLPKPLHVAELTTLVERCLRYSSQAESSGTGADLADDSSELVLLGRSRAMVEVFKSIGRVARQQVAVLLIGERGSGKRLVARAIHRHSGRPGPLLELDCAAIPEPLLERELFGREEGTVEGAEHRGMRILERARQGTLFLDQVGGLPLLLQGKLLRVLEERTAPQPAGDSVIAVDARLIAGTSQELGDQVAGGGFRQDLFASLAELTIRIPPLRERGEDLHLLADECVRRLAARVGRKIESIEPELYERLERHSWPGNIPELWTVLEQALLRAAGPVLAATDVPDFGSHPQSGRAADRLVTLEQTQIARVLEETGWNQSEAARRLGIHRNTLGRKIREYHLQPPGPGVPRR